MWDRLWRITKAICVVAIYVSSALDLWVYVRLELLWFHNSI